MSPAHSLWALSLFAEAVALATYWRRGGFVAFRVMLAADIVLQIADIAASGTGWYMPVFRLGNVVIGFLTAFAVIEAAPVSRGRGYRAGVSLGVALIFHSIAFSPTPWARLDELVWSFVALGHCFAAAYLWYSMMAAWQFSRHGVLLVVYLAAMAICFYLAPVYDMGRWVMGVNLLCWVAFAWPGPFPKRPAYHLAQN